MLKKIILVLIGIYFSQGMILAKTSEQIDKAVYTLGFSTYLSHIDKYFAGFDVYTDNKGNVYISGNTRDKNFPATEGAYQTELKGEADAFVAKFSPEGKIVFATLIGGTKREHHTGLTIDKQGYIYIVGGTHSSDFPVTSGAYDTSFNGEKGWGGDVYIVKLNQTGSDIIFSTFIGGSAQETAHQIKIDSEKNIIITGITLSQDFPITKGVIDKKCDKDEGFLAKFSPNGDKLIFSTYFGGNNKDGISGLVVDNKGDIYISGSTMSDDLPTTDNAIRNKLELDKKRGFRNGKDLFLAKVNKNGTKLLYCTYFGGKSHSSTSLAWISPNRLMISGNTDSGSFPISKNAIGKKIKGDRDGFISIFDSDTMKLEYSTLFGGNQYDYIRRAFFLNEDMVVVGGVTNSADLPITNNAIDSVYPVSDKRFNSTFIGRRKAFVSIIDIKRGDLIYSTYLGACLRFKIFPDKSGNLGFMAETGMMGFPGVFDFPLSRNAFQVPPTFIMLGRLVLNKSIQKK